MHTTVEEKLPQLRKLCRHYNVARLELFGSAVSEKFDPYQSDLDFLVEYLPNLETDALEEFFGFKKALEILFERKIDLIEPRAIRNRYFREDLEDTKVPVYAA